MSEDTKLIKAEVVLARIPGEGQPDYVLFGNEDRGYGLRMSPETDMEMGSPDLVTVTVEPGARPGWGTGYPSEAYDAWRVTES